jgi:hypothetical protein
MRIRVVVKHSSLRVDWLRRKGVYLPVRNFQDSLGSVLIQAKSRLERDWVELLRFNNREAA